ncbi:Uncharacterized protein Fot_31296 [Forsythia ovata]|uniref:Uncharacterized protein n=1 Tax=Forsythia ovata TaxID=205694 RepID=A0ABD1T4J8_9LAMI
MRPAWMATPWMDAGISCLPPPPTTLNPLSSNAPHADVTATPTAVMSKNYYFHHRTPPWSLNTSLITATTLHRSLPTKRRNSNNPTFFSPPSISSPDNNTPISTTTNCRKRFQSKFTDDENDKMLEFAKKMRLENAQK